MTTHKVLVLGSSGVGKSSFVNMVCSKIDLTPSSTVGCAVTVTPHQYRAGTSEEQNEFIELWDIGGSSVHQRASAVFFEGAGGAVLVHDLSNSKSEASLSQWLNLLRGDGYGNAHPIASLPSVSNLRPLLADVESTPIPTLIVGCKLDLAPDRAKQSGFDRINVDCRREMIPGSTNRIILSKFFDSVIERTKAPAVGERRRRLIM